MTQVFNHENLTVYQEAIAFVAYTSEVLETVPRSLSVNAQLDRAATSIPLNIAEGNGKYTAKDRCRYFDIARGSALECGACLDVLVAKNKLQCSREGKQKLAAIVSMLVGLIKSTSPDRMYEEKGVYAGFRQDQ